MIYRMANQFLEMWFQNRDSWYAFYCALDTDSAREALVESTYIIMVQFINEIKNYHRNSRGGGYLCEECKEEITQPEQQEE